MEGTPGLPTKGTTTMKKLAMLFLALAATILPAEMALARGGGRGGRGRGGAVGRGIGKGSNKRRNNPKDKKSRQLMKDRALAENRDAIKRDARVDSI